MTPLKHQPDPRFDLFFERIIDVPREVVWKEFPNVGCYLEIVPNEKLVWTNALLPGYRPAPPPADNVAACDTFFFTAILLLERLQKGTKYTALVVHKDEAGKKQHEAMGFHEGWNKALDQLVTYVKTL